MMTVDALNRAARAKASAGPGPKDQAWEGFLAQLEAGEFSAQQAPLVAFNAGYGAGRASVAKGALMRLLRYAPESEVVFRRADGSPITAGQMLRLLDSGDKAAQMFVEDIEGAALRAMRLRFR